MPCIAGGLLKRKLAAEEAVLVEGAKWCGKTTTSSRQAPDRQAPDRQAPDRQAGSILYMQDPDPVEQNPGPARIRPSRLLKGEPPRLMEEWQPADPLPAENLRDAVRSEAGRRKELGSSS